MKGWPAPPHIFSTDEMHREIAKSIHRDVTENGTSLDDALTRVSDSVQEPVRAIVEGWLKSDS